MLSQLLRHRDDVTSSKPGCTMFDIVISNGTLIDGSGQAAFKADLGICGDRITAIGDLGSALSAARHDAEGCVVAPGFIDVHTHSDYALLLDNRSESQVRQGITTELVGLCGFSLAPCTAASQKHMLEAFHTGFEGTVGWNGFAEYLDALAALKPATNIAALTGHGALRHQVMEGSKARPANEDEVARMARLLDEAMQEGAFGLSTGLEYHPGKEAQLAELEALCAVVGRHDGMHATHLRNRDRYFACSLAEAMDIARNTGSRLQVSHINPKFGRHEGAMQEALVMIDRARASGCQIGMDVMPTNWNHTSAKALLPSWAHTLTSRELLHLMQSPEGRARLAQNPAPIWQLAVQDRWERIRVFNGSATLGHRGKSIEELRKVYGGSGWDTLCALLSEEGESLFSLHLTGESFYTEEILAALGDAHCAVCSDTIAVALDGPLAGLRLSPNAYIWCEEFLRRFVREMHALSLPEAIRRLTSLPAQQIGLDRRGLLRPGHYADVCIFRFEELADDATLSSPAVYPRGVDAVMVNGVWAYREGRRNPIHSGHVLRNGG